MLVVGALIGPRGLWRRGRSHPFDAASSGVLIAIGVTLSRLWERAYGSHLRIDPAGIPAQLGPALRRVPIILVEYVGVFGSLDTILPFHTTALWLGGTTIVILLAFYVGSWAERLILLATVLGNLAVIFGLSVLLVVGTTFDVQGRHVLPLAVMVPLLAGAILARRIDRLPVSLRREPLGAWSLAAFAGFVGLFQLFAWYWNARRHGVGLAGKFRFFDRAEWYPVGGWWPWATLVVIGAALLLLPPLVTVARGDNEQAPAAASEH